MSQPPLETPPAAPRPGRWRRRLKRTAIVALVLLAVAAFLVKDHVRTLWSLRRVPGTNAYVMDYYVDYHMDKIRTAGMDVHNIQDSFLETFYPGFLVPIAKRVKHWYVPTEVKLVGEDGEHCSTVALHAEGGDVFFGRNFDYGHDACLILRVHDRDGLASISVIDLAYLDFNRADLDETSLIRRVPLLFAPYYVMDGMNRHGVAVSNMTVRPVKAPRDPQHPEIILSTLERLILDYAEDADQAVELVRAYNVHFTEATEHLMVADASGRSRIIEFIDGQIRVTPGERSWQISTNDIVWQKSDAERAKTCRRYRAGSAAAEKLRGPLAYADARQVARSMSVDNWTMWTSIYNLKTGDVGVVYRNKLDAEYQDAIQRVEGGER